ncbi:MULTISPECIES: class 1 fructose-bisphosphatase [unclassified Methanoregula]|uniref:class 1 fructose-bisphosphatase n=1 Tax=unclassified Methanoregula TaxID=2649730 RepID=UPI0009C991E9|nr:MULTISPECIES: class 1 fructose-bisphosphatase [unclassified Methanoregula]OPX65235.1 MAG: fructose-1,6-bisphosphatase [Methanoregula sp. PtaB.Bin085]OPY32144.1 MAG: fructose-1,6-bisphosphatase [Methanoregula sp. PtaU1.Bin006]
MRLSDFLKKQGTEKNLAELILFLGRQSLVVKKGFLTMPGKGPEGERTRNVFGEEQMPLDKYADGVFIDALRQARLARYIATEEQEQIIEIPGAKNDFGIVMDPLDGSSLIDVNLCIGTIIGICPGNVLDKGSRFLAALYILYGPLTTLTYTTGKGVHEFMVDESGEFVLRHQDLRIPDGKIYAPGALRKDWIPAHARWIEDLEKSGYKLRFSGSFVADVHQILHKGGVFTYPGIKGKDAGKLRLLYEANPMGRIIAEAGGAVSNGKEDLLNIQPASISQVTPVYIGGKKEIALIEKFMREG